MKNNRHGRIIAVLSAGIMMALSAVGSTKIHAEGDTPQDTTIDIDVEKVWEDADNKDNTRPESINVDLKNPDGTVARTITISPDTEGKWNGTFEDVPRFDDQGKEINYIVEEQPVNGYVASVKQGEVISDYDYPTNISTVTPDTSTPTPKIVDVTGSKTYKIQPGLRTDMIKATGVVFNTSKLNVGLAEFHEYNASGAEVTGTDNAQFQFRKDHSEVRFFRLGSDTKVTKTSDHSITLKFPDAVTVLDGTSTGTTAPAVLTISNVSLYKYEGTDWSRILYGALAAGPGNEGNSAGGLKMDMNFKVPGVETGEVLISFTDIDVINNAGDSETRTESVYLMKGIENTIYTLPLSETTPTTRVTYTYFKEVGGWMRAYAKGQDSAGSLQSGFVCRANLSEEGFNLRWTGTSCATSLFTQVKPFALKTTVDQKTAGGNGGTISEQHDWQYRNYGEAKIITLTPNENYHINTITIDGTSVDVDGFDDYGVMTISGTGWIGNGRTGKEDITLYQRANGVVDVYLPKQFYAVNNTAPARTDHWIDVSFISNGVAQDYTITNTLTEDITGTKTWVAGTASHPENTALNLTLMQKVSGQADEDAVKYDYDPATQLSWNGNTYKITGIPKYNKDGAQYVYRIEEGEVAGFDTTYDETHLKITNTLIQKPVSIIGMKYWKDGAKEYEHNNAEELILTLYRKSAAPDSRREEVEGATPVWNGDIYTFSDLPQYDENRYEYKYSVDEKMIDDAPDYLDPGDYYESKPDATGLSFVNTLKGYTSFSGTKTWIDPGKTHNNETDVSLVLISVDHNGKRTQNGTYKATWDGNKYTYSNLPKYDADGYPLTYSVRENRVMGKSAAAADYAISYDGGPDWDRQDYNLTGRDITNRKSGKTTVTGTKTWVNGTAVTEHNNAEEVKLILSRKSAKEGSEPETLTNAVPTWDENTYTFSDLDLYDMEGYQYTYSVSEEPIDYYKTEQDGFNFTNTYIMDSVTYAIPVRKVLRADEGLNAPDITEKYTFTLKEGDTVIDEKTNPDADGGTATFKEITYDKEGIYTYTVTETGSVDGVTNDTTSTKTVTVTVKDSGEGKLVVESATSTAEDPVTFTNIYTVKALAVKVPVTKTLNKAEGLEGPDITGKYTFTITDDPEDDVVSPLPDPNTITNPASNGGTASFGNIIFTRTGTYSYKIAESGSVEGVTNDEAAERTVKVVVTDNGNGTMSAVVNGGTAIEFINTYNVTPVDAAITVQKNLNISEVTEQENAEQEAPEEEAAEVEAPEEETTEQETPELEAAEQETAIEAPDITGAFTFTIADDPSDEFESPLPAETTITNPESAGGQAAFGAVTYSAPGTYRYLITETGTVTGVVNDATTVKPVTVVVTDNRNGTLTAVVNSNDTPVEFNNSYHEVKVVLTAEKVLKSADSSLVPPDITGLYTFTLKEGENVLDEKTNPGAAGGTVSFNAITLNEPGTYTYTVTESGEAPGVTNDEEPTKTITVTVVRNGDGTLTATANDGKPVQFVNTYQVTPTTAVIPVQKTLYAREGMVPPDVSNKFTFTLKEGDTVIGETTNPEAAGGTAEFGAIEYTKPGEYKYTITESGTVNGVTNDSVSTRNVSVVVTDNRDGTLSASVNGGTVTEFLNTYNAEEVSAYISVNKTLAFEDGLIPGDIKGKFKFTLNAEGDTPMPETTSYTNPDVSGGTVTFGPITFKNPGTYTYTVTEEGSAAGVTNDAEASKTVTVVVVDSGDGALKATVNDGKEVIFTNTYSVKPVTADIPVKKILNHESDETPADQTGKFTFTLRAEGDAPMPAAAKVTNPDADGGTAVFKGIEFKKPGTYTYTVTESGTSAGVTNDPESSKTVTVKVTDNSDGTLSAVVNNENVVTFTNTYGTKPVQIDPPVVKQIIGARPKTSAVFYFTMVAQGDAPMMEGAQDGRKTVSVTGAGETEFGIIRYTEPGVYNYTIIEENTNLPGYTYDSSVWSMKVVVEDNGKGELTAERIFQKGGTTAEKPVFVNQYTKIIVPDTSDHTNMIGWAAALLISLLIASFTGFALKKW